MSRTILYRGAVYHVANVIPDFSTIWDAVQENETFEHELNALLSDTDDDFGAVMDRLEEEYQDYYDDIVDALKQLDQKDCWRAVTLPSKVDPSTVEPLGIYWSWNQTEAVPHWSYMQEGKKGIVAVFRGKVKLAAVDLHDTVMANVSPSSREDGTEVRFRKGERIWIHDAALYRSSSYSEDFAELTGKPFKTVVINDWRTI